MIPPILHYVWVGSPLPAKQQAFIDSWRDTNPHFQIMCWNEDNINMNDPMLRDAYDNRKWAKVADIARLNAVLTMGGIYLDTDFRLFKPLDSLLHHSCFFAFQEEEAGTDWVCNGAFGAAPGHWFVQKAFDELHKVKSRWFLPERPTDFGPKHITRLLRREGLNRYDPNGVMIRDVFLAPVPMFFPFHHTEQFHPNCIRDETLGAHFWEKSWNASIPLPLRIARDARNGVRRTLRTFTHGKQSKCI